VKSPGFFKLGSCFSFFFKLLSFFKNVFFVFIIILYNKNKMFLFHFYIFVYLDASLKFGERRYTSFFFQVGFFFIIINFIFFNFLLFIWFLHFGNFFSFKIILLYFSFLVSFVSIPFL